MVNNADSNTKQDDHEEANWAKKGTECFQDTRSAVLIKTHRGLGSTRTCARKFLGDDVVSGSVDALPFVVSRVLFAPASPPLLILARGTSEPLVALPALDLLVALFKMAFHMDAVWTCVTLFAKALHPDLVAILVGSAFCVIFALAEQGPSVTGRSQVENKNRLQHEETIITNFQHAEESMLSYFSAPKMCPPSSVLVILVPSFHLHYIFKLFLCCFLVSGPELQTSIVCVTGRSNNFMS